MSGEVLSAASDPREVLRPVVAGVTAETALLHMYHWHDHWTGTLDGDDSDATAHSWHYFEHCDGAAGFPVHTHERASS